MSLKSPSEGLAFFHEAMAEIERADEREAARLGFATVQELRAARSAEREAAEAQRKEGERRNHVRAVLAHVGSRVTDDVARALFLGGELDDTPAHLAVTDWLESQKPALVLSGGTGTGKTVAAVRAMVRYGSYQFVRAIRVGAHFERWASDREDGVDPLRLGCSFLVLDDLGQEAESDRRAAQAVEEILDHRQRENTRTLITTNLTPDAIKARYSDRVVSRLRQNATVKAVNTTDMRRARG
jgi:DNA replication protein DnaC